MKISTIPTTGADGVLEAVWKILKEYPKRDAAEPIDGDNLQEVFGPDKRERPAGKQRAGKKQKSVHGKRLCYEKQSQTTDRIRSMEFQGKRGERLCKFSAKLFRDLKSLAGRKCLAPVMTPGSLANMIAAELSQYILIGLLIEGITPRSSTNFLIQTASIAASRQPIVLRIVCMHANGSLLLAPYQSTAPPLNNKDISALRLCIHLYRIDRRITETLLHQVLYLDFRHY
ncbi:hypothetical protein Tco_1326771 [Tanacetum coccineum]